MQLNEVTGAGPDPTLPASLWEEQSRTEIQAEGEQFEDTGRSQPSARHGERPREKSTCPHLGHELQPPELGEK